MFKPHDVQVLRCEDPEGTLLAVGNADREGVVCAQCERTVPLPEFAHTCAGLPKDWPFAGHILSQANKSLQVGVRGSL